MLERIGHEALHCKGCDESFHIPRVIATDPEKRAMFCEYLDQEHAGCEQFPESRLAKLARTWTKGFKKHDKAGTPAPAERA